MIENLLRRLTSVHSRITVNNLALVVIFVLATPLVLADHNFLVDRLEQVTEVELRADRLLLRASTKVADSRTNFSRFIQGFTSDARVALSETGQSIVLLQEAADLPISSEQQQAIESVLVDLAKYERLVNEVETARQAGQEQMVELEVAALQLGSDISVRIDQTVQESEIRLAETNKATLDEAQSRLILYMGLYVIILGLSFLLARSIQQSITKPIAALQQGAEEFRRGRWETTIPVSGSDELSSLAATFNQMARDLAESQVILEQRISQRSQSLEISAQVSHNLSSILDLDAFAIAVVEQLQDTFNYYYVQLYLANDENDTLTLKSATGRAGQNMLIQGHQIEVGRGIVGKAAVTRAVIVSPDVNEDPQWLSNPLLPETKCEAAVPIISRGRVLGILDIQHSVVNGISDEEVTLLQSISDQIAIALENARLFDQIQRQARYEAVLNQVTQKIQTASTVDQVLQLTVQEVSKALNADLASVQLGKPNTPANGQNKTS